MGARTQPASDHSPISEIRHCSVKIPPPGTPHPALRQALLHPHRPAQRRPRLRARAAVAEARGARLQAERAGAALVEVGEGKNARAVALASQATIGRVVVS